MHISFDTTGFQQQDQSNRSNPANGDRLNLTCYDLVPDLPAGLDDLPKLRHDPAVLHGQDGCLIEAHVVQLAGTPALLRIIKVPLPNRPAGRRSCARSRCRRRPAARCCSSSRWKVR